MAVAIAALGVAKGTREFFLEPPLPSPWPSLRKLNNLYCKVYKPQHKDLCHSQRNFTPNSHTCTFMGVQAVQVVGIRCPFRDAYAVVVMTNRVLRDKKFDLRRFKSLS